MSKTLTPTELAATLGTDAKTTRKFLRSVTPKENHPGKGSRWSIEARQVRSLKSQFSKWNAQQEADRAERAAKRAEEANAAVTEDETLEDENLNDTGFDTNQDATPEELGEDDSE